MTERDDIPVEAFAYYLPQFYPLELNSQYWGEGFTEWVSLVRAHAGWRSPRGTTLTPGELGFYDLRDPDVRKRQGQLAAESGLAALCIYHYWSAGHRHLPAVEDAILADGQPDFTFFFGWANHDWTLMWQGRSDIVTQAQEYDEHENDHHIEWLLDRMEDPRYYRVDGRPVLLVYDPLSVTQHRRTFDRWRDRGRQRGWDLLLLGATRAIPRVPPETEGLDAWVQGTAHVLARGGPRRRALTSLRSPGRALRHFRHRDVFWRYRDLARQFDESLAAFPGRTVPVVISTWNNVGRRTQRASSTDSTPDAYERAVARAAERAPVLGTGEGARRLVALNAWNEWGEGMVLEPSTEWGRAYVEATRRGLS